MFIKIHKTGQKEILAVCDEDIIGKKFEQGDLCIEVSEVFYKDKKVDKKELEDLLKYYDNINIVGKDSIKIALELGIIEKESIIQIKGIPHVQIFAI